MTDSPEARLALAVQLAAFPGRTLSVDAATLLEDGLGGVCLFGSNTVDGLDGVRRLTTAIHAAQPEAVVAVDEEGGDVTRLHVLRGSPVLGPGALGAAGDLAATRATGLAVGHELAALGVDLDLAPVADVNCDPDNPVIGTRSFGVEPAAVAGHVVAWLGGLQAAGVAACVKHFPGHGATSDDSHHTLPTVGADAETLRARELLPFAAASAAGVATAMTAHVLVPALDPDRPATFSPRLLSLLREELGFGGAIVTDALDMAGASGTSSVPEAAVSALVAGADLLCLGADKDAALVRSVQSAVVAAVRAGRLAEERLADAARRVASIRRPRPAPTSTVEPRCDPTPTAEASVRVDGPIPGLGGAAVLRLDSPATPAVGGVPWGLAADVVVDPAARRPLADVPHGRPLVVQVRDAHRQEPVRSALDALALRGQDVVVVEWGWPGPAREGVARVLAHGWSRPGAAAVLAVLRGAGFDR